MSCLCASAVADFWGFFCSRGCLFTLSYYVLVGPSLYPSLLRQNHNHCIPNAVQQTRLLRAEVGLANLEVMSSSDERWVASIPDADNESNIGLQSGMPSISNYPEKNNNN